MNYASQLKGWAVDRVIEAKKAGYGIGGDTLAGLLGAADELANACYIPETDFNDTVQHLAKLLKEVSDPLEKVQGLIAELGLLEEDIERQLESQARLQPTDVPIARNSVQ